MKKTINRFISLSLALVLIAAVACACGGKESSVSIEDMEKKLKEHDDDLNFEIQKNGNDTLFSYDDGYHFSYDGIANSNKKVKEITVSGRDVDSSALSDSDSLMRITLKSSGQLTLNDIYVIDCILIAGNLYEAVGGNSDSVKPSDLIEVFSNGKVLKTGDWTVKASVGNGTCKIVAEFGQ